MMHGAPSARGLIRAGLFDEVEIHLVPVLLSADRRLFNALPPEHVRLELVRSLQGSGVLHLRYQVAQREA